MFKGIIIYEDVVFDMYEQGPYDSEPWAMVCNECNEELLEGAGSGNEIVKKLKVATRCHVEGCANKADVYITLVGSEPQ